MTRGSMLSPLISERNPRAEVRLGVAALGSPVGDAPADAVPASMPRTWHRALDNWRAMDVDCLGRGSYLGVPRVDAVQWTRPRATYWSAPLDSPSMLCSPVEVARLIAAGRHCMPAEPEA